MFKSLRWRLQAWHALILLLAVAGFGSVLYLQISKSRYDEIDGDLVAAARTLEGAMRAIPRPMLQNGLPDGPPEEGNRPPPEAQDFDRDRPPPRDDLWQAIENLRRPNPDGRPQYNPDPNRRPDFNRPPDPLQGRRDQPPPGDRQPRPQPNRPMPPEQIRRMLNLPQSFVERFTENRQGPYFKIWAANGQVIKEDAIPSELPEPVRLPTRPDVDFRAQQRGHFREVILDGPEQTRILVGRPIGRETAELGRLFWTLVLTGLGVFATGLLGGWWLSGRAVKPIAAMSKTAASISATSLNQRIDVADIDSELAALGIVLNAMFDRLQSSINEQMRFTADASHELRTPLSVILTHAELALNRPRTPEDYRETLETCFQAGRRMKLLVEDLLVLARADAGKLQLRSARLELKQMLEDCSSMLEPLAAERNVTITVGGEPTWVNGDPDRLGQLLTNLLSNAVFYNVEGGKVWLNVCTEVREAVITISDTGVGISPNDLPHLFERFYRVDKARSRSTGGNGLGLAICKSIVEAHGGIIAVSNRPEGGTIVTVRLPAAAAAVEASANGSAKQVALPSVRPRLVEVRPPRSAKPSAKAVE